MARRLAAANLLLIPFVLLGCASTTPQSLSVDYFDGQSESTVEIKVREVHCTDLASRRIFISPDGKLRESSTFAAMVSNAAGQSTVTLKVAENLWFYAMGDYASSDDTVVFEDMKGSIAPRDSNG